MKTLVKKILELADMRSLKINLIIYDAKLHRLEEIWSHADLSIGHINNLMKELDGDSCNHKKKSLKFESVDARLKYKIEEDDLS